MSIQPSRFTVSVTRPTLAVCEVIQTGIAAQPVIHSQPHHGCHPEAQPKDLRLLFLCCQIRLPAYHVLMHEGAYCTYMMASRSHTLYIGVTGYLLKRVFQHKWKEHGGFTARYNCDRLVWFERHQDVQTAIAREKELKGWRRSKKIALIESVNPTWDDFSRNWYDCEPADYRRALDRMDA